MSTASAAEEKTPARPTTAAAEPVNTSDTFRPILFLLSSLTADFIEAAVVARQLQPHFREGDFYIINAAPFVTPHNSPFDGKKGGGNGNNNASGGSGGVSLISTPGSTSESVKVGIQTELARIAATREAARQAAAQAKASQLASLQEEYMEDGLAAEDALAAAHAELHDHSDSEAEDVDAGGGRHDPQQHEGEGVGGAATRRLPPCVCVLNMPLTCSVIDRFARAIPGVAAALLLESRCYVRELVSNAAAAAPAGPAGAGEKTKGRGGAGTGGNVASLVNSKVSSPFTDDLLEYLSGAPAQLLDDGSGLPNILVQRIEYPTENTSGGGGVATTATAFRPAASSAQFVSTLHAQLLRIFFCFLRYESWRQGRVCVRVPPYVPARDAEATASAIEGKTPEELQMPTPDRRLSKRKSAGAATDASSASAAAGTAVAIETSTGAAATAAAQPHSMADVAAERFEYATFMQRWSASQQRSSPSSASNDALHASLAACLYQIGSGHATSVLRSRADASAAQLQEDVQAAMEMCAEAHRLGSGIVVSRQTDVAVAAQIEVIRTAALQTLFTANKNKLTSNSDGGNLSAAETIEAAMAQCIAAGTKGADARSSVYAAIASTAGDGDASQWLRRVLAAREQQGWDAASCQWQTDALCCLRRSTEAHRTAHSAFVFRGPTTFPQFYRDEDFLVAEGRVYELNSSSSESEADEGEEEEEEEENEEVDVEDDECELENSAAELKSVGVANNDTTDTSTTAARSLAAQLRSTPSAPVIDHAAVVIKRLRRRRVFEQVRACHARPAVQEVGVLGDRCQAVVTETTWLRAVDGTLIEVTKTVANSCQVRCTVMADAADVVQGGYMLECPPRIPPSSSSPASFPNVTSTPLSAAPDEQPQQRQSQQSHHSLELTVESGVRGFLEVGDRLRVFTTVVANNSHAVELATHALAVAAAKEAALAQYEAQFNKGTKAAKGREKVSTSASPLSLDDIEATLLAAVPPLPSSSGSTHSNAAAHEVSPPLMQVHTLFPTHHCVLTCAVSQAAVPGVRLALLPNSDYVAPPASPGIAAAPLLTVHLWWENQLCVVPVLRLSAAHVYVDGVAELFSPDLPPGVRVVLHPNGSYIAEAGSNRLFVNARGRCTLHCGNVPGVAGFVAVVHTLQSGWAAAVTNLSIRRAEREDGLQQEFFVDDTAAGFETASGSFGRPIKTLFGPGVIVCRGDRAQTWSWRVAGLPLLHCSGSPTRHVAAALDGEGMECWVYVPDQRLFELRVRRARTLPESCHIAASLSLRTSRITLWSSAADSSPSSSAVSTKSGFVIDCAYGGVCGRVQTSHLYRVSPFGRCSEEFAVMQGDTATSRWQLVLPPYYKRPKKKEPEVVLVAEYASDAFHRAVSGSDTVNSWEQPRQGAEGADRKDVATTGILHQQRDPWWSHSSSGDDSRADTNEGKPRDSEASSYISFFADTLSSAPPAAVKLPVQEVRCAALSRHRTLNTFSLVMDAVSWATYARWLERLPETTLRHSQSPLGEKDETDLPSRLRFKLVHKEDRSHELYPLTVVDDEAVSEPVSSAQHCILLHHLSNASSGAPAWYTTRALSKALEECRHCEVRSVRAREGPSTAVVQRSDERENADEVGDASLEKDTTQAFTAATSDTLPQGNKEMNVNAQVSVAHAESRSSSPSAKNVFCVPNYWASPCCPRTPLPIEPRTSHCNSCSENTEDKESAVASITKELSSSSSAVAAFNAGECPPTASAPSSTSVSNNTRSRPPNSSKIPLMQSYRPAADAQTGTTASSRFHAPLLSVQPQHIDFGNVPKGRRYVATFELTNTSTVPCRYRVRPSAAVRSYVTLTYPRHFVAPGITVTVSVELSGWQPHGVVDSELTVVHEGGTTEVGIVWCTTDATHNVQLGRGVVCAGWSVSKPVLQHLSKSAASDMENGEMEEDNSCNGDSDTDASVQVRTV